MCIAVIETLIENKDEIVLDAANNVFVGPNNYFKIVVDSFDGNVIKAWHFEGPNGEKSGNLAEFAHGKHLDALINAVPNATTRFHYEKLAPKALERFIVQKSAVAQ